MMKQEAIEMRRFRNTYMTVPKAIANTILWSIKRVLATLVAVFAGALITVAAVTTFFGTEATAVEWAVSCISPVICVLLGELISIKPTEKQKKH